MKINKLKFNIIAILLTLISIFFLLPILQIQENATATIENVSGSKYVLTSTIGNSAEHYFKDDEGNSTLYGSKISDQGGEYYSLVDDTGVLLNKTSGGYAVVRLTSDINQMIEKGLVYATAEFEFQAKNNNNQSNIDVVLSQGDNKVSVSTSYNNKEKISYKTEMMQLTLQSSEIKFTWNTKAATKAGEYSNFVLSEPRIRLYTRIENITFENESQIVNAGQIVKLNAYNDITTINNASGNLLNYSKLNHQIQFVIVEGSEYASIIENYIYINDDAPDDAIISVKAVCKKTSYDDSYLESENIVDFTISSSQVEVKIDTDFENPATIIGEGVYNVGRRIFLRIIPNENFTFKGLYINDQLVSTSLNYSYLVTAGDRIYAKFIKDITIASIDVNHKIYDGTTNINPEDIIYNFNGVEKQHNVFLTNAEIHFGGYKAGKQEIIVNVNEGESVVLAGEDAEKYNLKDPIVPKSYATIYKRDVTIVPTTLQKQYGDKEPTILFNAFNLIEGDEFTGNLQRENGEEIGEYLINIGDLYNENYNIIFEENKYYFSITQRQLSLEGLKALDKTYDKTTDVTLSYSLINIVNDEEVDITIKASFEDCNAGSFKKVIIENYQLLGNDKDNYYIDNIPQELSANILKKQINVVANESSVVYGEEINLTYTVEGLLEGDMLEGQLSISDFNVGLHEISLGSLNNNNYNINFTSANCNISKRQITVTADQITKEFGDVDPALTYTVDNLLPTDSLIGSLSREEGENVGEYKIVLGSLSNINYNINLISNTFEIVKREITVQISFADKVYDGTKIVEFTHQYINKLSEQNLELTLRVELQNANAGKQDVEILETNITGDYIENCNFNFQYTNTFINVSRKNVVVSIENTQKTYGENDPEIIFSIDGLIDGESLIGLPKRNVGENVGIYSYYLDSLNNENNANYNIIYNNIAYMTINKRNIDIKISNLSKYFGDEDLAMNFIAKDESQLQYQDTVEDLYSKQIERESGENVGSYAIIIDNSALNGNYNFNFESLNFNILRRPITVEIQNAEKVYGDEDPEFVYTTTNVLEDEPLLLTVKRQYNENVGVYELTLESSYDERYEIIELITGKLTINPSNISLKAASKVKYYGDADPYFDVVIIDGLLKNGDVLANIQKGKLERQEGENVGNYQITQGSYNLGENYIVDFSVGNLEIVKQPIKIVAEKYSKQYGDIEPILGFDIVEGSLKFNDDFEGALSREQGEEIGTYNITIGTLTLNDNYELIFESNVFEITKRNIEIIPQTLSKEYGEEEPKITYVIIGDLVNDDELLGNLYRDKPSNEENPLLYEDVGSYKIYSTLSHEKYNITFGNYYFKVTPKIIEIQAQSSSKTYGEKDPDLTYTILNGEILEGDELTGDVYRVSGENAGTYDIRSTLTLGKNYSIIFQKGVFTINPIEIVIQSQNYTKTYGSLDPYFEYQIVEGQLINNDVLYGNIAREAGENVGVYKLISNLSNINYNIVLKDAFLLIEKKDAYLKASVYDKIYDGTNKAVIKTPVVTGLVDNDLILSYDKNNCVYFITEQVGDNIPVVFYDIKLEGESASNYNLILPTDVVGNITYNQLATSNETVVVEAVDNACLYYDTTLNFSTFDIKREEMNLNKYQVLNGFEIWLEKDGEKVDLSNTIQLTIKVDKNYADRNNFYVYHKTADGKYVLVNSQNNNGELVINIDELGEFVIMTDNDQWIDIASYVCIAVLSMFVLVYGVYYIKNRKPNKNKE